MDRKRDFEDLTSELREVLALLDAGEVQAGPAGRWNIQQIVEHLLLTYTSTTRLTAERLAKGGPTLTQPRLWQHLQRTYVVGCGIFPRGVSAPAVVIPAAGSPAATGPELLARVEEELRLLDGTLHEAIASFGPKCRFATHAILGPLHAGEWRRFHRVHGLHHVRQIRAILRSRSNVVSPGADLPRR